MADTPQPTLDDEPLVSPVWLRQTFQTGVLRDLDEALDYLKYDEDLRHIIHDAAIARLEKTVPESSGLLAVFRAGYAAGREVGK